MITSKDNEIIKRVSKLMTGAKYRRECGLFVAEGARICADGARSGAAIDTFLYTERAREKYAAEFECIASRAERSFEVSEPLFRKMGDTDTPQGMACIFRIPDRQTLLSDIRPRHVYLALENIQDPSNMGTILRSAEAFGTDGIILSRDCCDIYAPKVVRGSMGAIFRLAFAAAEDFTAVIGDITRRGIPTYASTPHQARDINTVDFSQGGVMLVGNEGNGLTQQTIAACSERVKISMRGRAESLNASAAAAVLLYEINSRFAAAE